MHIYEGYSRLYCGRTCRDWQYFMHNNNVQNSGTEQERSLDQ